MGWFSKKKKNEKASITEKLQNKGVHCIIVLEIAGRPADYIKKAMKLVLKALSDEKGVEILSKKSGKIKKTGTLFSTFSEVEMIVDSLSRLISIIFGYTPSSIEIIAPLSLKLEVNDANNLLNDLASKIHKVEMVAKRLGIENEILKKQIEEMKSKDLGNP